MRIIRLMFNVQNASKHIGLLIMPLKPISTTYKQIKYVNAKKLIIDILSLPCTVSCNSPG